MKEPFTFKVSAESTPEAGNSRGATPSTPTTTLPHSPSQKPGGWHHFSGTFLTGTVIKLD